MNIGCPRCGSTDIEVVTETNGTTKGFGAGKGCCGYIILGPIGLLCGLCGMGEGRTTTDTYRICRKCGARFK